VTSTRRIITAVGAVLFVPLLLLGLAFAINGAFYRDLGVRGLFVLGGSTLALTCGVLASLPIWLTWSAQPRSVCRVLSWTWLICLLLLALSSATWLVRDASAVGRPVIGAPSR
jgi:hypothetical protein